MRPGAIFWCFTAVLLGSRLDDVGETGPSAVRVTTERLPHAARPAKQIPAAGGRRQDFDFVKSPPIQ
jgi:hypothetical protein